MWSAVSKSGSPISRWIMSFPRASSALAFARTENAVSVPRRPMRPASFTRPSLAVPVFPALHHGADAVSSGRSWRPGRGLGRTVFEGSSLVAERNGGLRFDLGAFDLDGTLLRRDLEITDRTLTAIQGLRRQGMRLVVATGRRYESAVEHAEKLGFGGEGPVGCYGGSLVRRMKRGEA